MMFKLRAQPVRELKVNAVVNNWLDFRAKSLLVEKLHKCGLIQYACYNDSAQKAKD